MKPFINPAQAKSVLLAVRGLVPRPARTIPWFAVSLLLIATFLAGCQTTSTPKDQLAIKVCTRQFPPRLDIFITNQTAHVVRVWKDSNSWGERNLSVQLQDEGNGSIATLVRRLSDYTKNVPAFDEIEPHSDLLRAVDLTDGWWLIPLGVDITNREYRVRVQLKIGSSLEARKLHVFVGEVCSEWSKGARDQVFPQLDNKAGSDHDNRLRDHYLREK